MVYLIHFDRKLEHAQHYIGYVSDNLARRIQSHKNGTGSALMRAVNLKGIDWRVVALWPDGSRTFERQLKNGKKASRVCPICNNKSHWYVSRDGDPIGLELYKRHYSRYVYKDGREHTRFVGPGERIVLIGKDRDALFVWRKFISANGQQGINCAVFRNEGKQASSNLIVQAEQFAKEKWGKTRLYTYVNPSKIRSTNPGYCFMKAGWKRCGTTAKGLLIFEKYI